jgi:hypothetical protein
MSLVEEAKGEGLEDEEQHCVRWNTGHSKWSKYRPSLLYYNQLCIPPMKSMPGYLQGIRELFTPLLERPRVMVSASAWFCEGPWQTADSGWWSACGGRDHILNRSRKKETGIL